MQLAVAKGLGMDVSAPVMAFVLPTDPWLTVVNEFLMVGRRYIWSLFIASNKN